MEFPATELGLLLMMTWSYRTLYNVDDGLFYITEYYEEDGKRFGYIPDGVQPIGDTKEELKECLERMLACFDQPTVLHDSKEDSDGD